MADERNRYLEEMGHEPPAPRDDDPLAWQWGYRGRPDERERLEAELRGERLPEEEPPTQDEELF